MGDGRWAGGKPGAESKSGSGPGGRAALVMYVGVKGAAEGPVGLLTKASARNKPTFQRL